MASLIQTMRQLILKEEKSLERSLVILSIWLKKQNTEVIETFFKEGILQFIKSRYFSKAENVETHVALVELLSACEVCSV